MDGTTRPVPTLAQRLTILRVIWGAMTASAIVYAVVGTIVATQFARTPVRAPEAQPTVLGALAVLAVVMAGLSIWWRGRTLTPDLVTSAATPDAAFARIQTGCVVSWALAEGVGVLGLVGTLLTGDVRIVLAFVAVAVVLIGTIHRPPAELLEQVRQRARVQGR